MRYVPLVLLALLVAACSSGGQSSLTPSPQIQTPTDSPSETVRALASKEVSFRGLVVDLRDARPEDGPLMVSVKVTDVLGGISAPSVGSTIGVEVACGFCIPCLGQWGQDIGKGYTVVALARSLDGYLTICPSEDLFVVPYGTTPIPTASPPPPPHTPCATLVYSTGALPSLDPCTSNEPPLVLPSPTP